MISPKLLLMPLLFVLVPVFHAQKPAKTTADLALDATRTLDDGHVESFYRDRRIVLRKVHHAWYYNHEARMAGIAIATALLDAPAVCRHGPSKKHICHSDGSELLAIVVGGSGSPPAELGLPQLSIGDVGIVILSYPLSFAAYDPTIDLVVRTEIDDPAAIFIDPAFGERTTAYWPSMRGGWPHYGAGGQPFPTKVKFTIPHFSGSG